MNKKEKTSGPGNQDQRKAMTNRLIRRCLEGETDCFGELVKEHQASVFALARTMVSSAEDAGDMTQESFVKAYTKLQGFKPEHSFRGWLLRITYNTCIDHLRKRKNIYTYIKRKSREWTEKDNPGYILVEKSEVFSPHLKKLNPRERAILLMKYDQGMSNIEIGVVTGCTPSTVSVHLFNARRRLKELMSGVIPRRQVCSFIKIPESAAGDL